MPKTNVNPVNYLLERQVKGSFKCDRLLTSERLANAQNLYRRDLHSHFGCVNAIEFSNDGRWMLSGGDDKRVLLWNMEKATSGHGSPSIMEMEHTSNIFCLGFDSSQQRLFSGGNDEHLIAHKADTGLHDQSILHNEAIYGLSIDPANGNLLATACNDGTSFIFDLRKRVTSCQDAIMDIKSHAAFHAIMHNPVQSQLLTTANVREGVALWDIRKLRSPVIKYTDSANDTQSAMSVRFNIKGTQILALRRRHSAILYNLASHFPIAEFDDSTYYNSCTMKSCCFAGDEDQYILSGSDDFKLYMWKIPQHLMDNQLKEREEPIFVHGAHLHLSGHRSIVNQVRYNYADSMIASSGVEKMIKLWSCYPMPGGEGSLDSDSNNENRKVYSHEDYISLVLHSGQFMTHDYSHQSTQEDPRMMAFFDSLVQRDIEGWTSDSGSDSVDGYTLLTFRSTSSSEMSDSDTNDNVLSAQTESYITSLVSRIDSHPDNKGDSCSHGENQSTSTFCVDATSEDGNESAVAASSTSEPIASNSSCSSCPRWSRFTGPSRSKAHNSGDQSRSNGARSNATNTAACSSNDRSNLSVKPPKKENSESDKIVQLIASKKIEQLRKTARVVARSTKRRLKKVRRRCKIEEKSGQSSSQGDKAFRYQKMSKLTQLLLNRLDQNTAKTPDPMRTMRNKSRKRLRRLTTQSDYILNEVYPTAGDTSSSDDDSDSDSDIALPHDLFATALAEADDRFAGESDSSSSSSQGWLTSDDSEALPSDIESDSGDEQNLITFGDPNDASSSSSSSKTNGRQSKKCKFENNNDFQVTRRHVYTEAASATSASSTCASHVEQVITTSHSALCDISISQQTPGPSLISLPATASMSSLVEATHTSPPPT